MATPAAPAKKPVEKKDDGKTPRERFLSVGANRVSKALKALRNLHNVSNRKSYEYSEADVNKLTAALDREYSAVKQAFADGLAGKTTATKGDGFSF